MKVIKDKDQSLLTGLLALKGKHYLCFSAMLCFDLAEPDLLATEKDLWTYVKAELGKGAVLDPAMPKPKAEVLVYGSCYAGGDESVQASRVSFRVGDVSKSLDVFGNRYWKTKGKSYSSITEPEPFQVMPVTYQHAFGGPEYPRNPLGKGISPVLNRKGDVVHPLPNIEQPDRFDYSPDKWPEPAGFNPYPVDWPQRREKAGTYDQKWLDSRWPFYPDDFQVEFFNTAPKDQQSDEYFKGNEIVEIKHMHPTIRQITSRLPGRKIRCFVTQILSGKSDETLFKEIDTRLDTVWLFPGQMKGLVLFRGTVPTEDDEGTDIKRVFLATEKLDQTPLSLDEYREIQEKRLSRTVEIDQAPIMEAKEKLATALNKVAQLPQKIMARQAKAFGKAPVMPKSPAETVAEAKGRLEKSKAMLDRLESFAVDMKAKHGHLMKIDTSSFNKMRGKLGELSQSLDKVQAQAEGELAKAEKFKKSLNDTLKTRLAELGAPAAHLNADDLFIGTPEKRWKKQGFGFVVQGRRNLASSPKALNVLIEMGLTKQTVQDAFLGINPESQRFSRTDWGLPIDSEAEAVESSFTIPAGLVIPRFDGAELKKIVIRPGNYDDSSQDILVEGSIDEPLMLGAGEGKAFVGVRDEMDAFLVHQEAGDFCATIVLKDAGRKPDKETAELLDAAPVFLILFSSEFLENPIMDWEAWSSNFPNAKALVLPTGDRPISTVKTDVDLRKLIRDALPDDLEKNLPPDFKKVTADDVKPGMALPRVDVKALMKGPQKEARALVAKKKAEGEAVKKQITKQAYEQVRKAGGDPEAMAAKAKALPPHNPLDPSMMVAALAQNRERLRAKGKLTPDAEAKFLKQEENLKTRTESWAKKFEKGMAKLAAAKEKKADLWPDWAKEMRENQGQDPQTGAALTREGVILRHAKGELFNGMNLAGLDLSGLELQHIDLSGTNCIKTNFTGSNLNNANLSGALLNEADFTKADLSQTRIIKSLLNKAKLVGANLSGADLTKSLLQEADLSEANLKDSLLRMTFMNKTILAKAKLNQARAGRVVFQMADINGADFSGADLTKAAFMKMSLDGAIFSKISAKSASFLTVNGKGVDFSESNLDNVRFIKKCALHGANFTNCNFGRACFMDSEFPDADFRGSRFHKGFIQGCNLTQTNFYKVPAHLTRFTKSDLSGANMKGINLFKGSLRKSRLDNTDLSGSNLFAVDFYKAVVAHTRFEMANLKRSQLHMKTDLLK